MRISIFLGITCFGLSLADAESTAKASPSTPCPSCEKGTSRLSAFQGDSACPKSCTNLCCTGETLELSIPQLIDQQSSAKVNLIISNIEGAKVEESCLNSHSTLIKYDPRKTTKATLINELKKAGFSVAGEKISYKISGMTCVNCSGKLSKALTSTSGVVSVEDVSHESQSASLVIDPTKTNATKIAQVIHETGYKVISE